MFYKAPRQKEGEQMRTRKKSTAVEIRLGSTSGEVKFKELALIPTFLHERFIDFEIRRQLFFAGYDADFARIRKERIPDGVKWQLEEP